MVADSIAWAAGLFEGEGCLYAEPRNRGLIRAVLSSTDEDVVRRFASVMGCGLIRERSYKKPLKDQWAWEAHGDDAEYAILRLSPWFGERRAEKARELLRGRAELRLRATRERTCPECGEMFVAPFNSGHQKRKYCSTRCSRLVAGRSYYKRNREAILARKREAWRLNRDVAMERVREFTWA